MGWLAEFFQKIASVVMLLLQTVQLVPVLFQQAQQAWESETQQQLVYMDALRASYAAGEYLPVNEEAFAAFSIEEAAAQGVRFSQLRFLGTHNSYKKSITPAGQQISRNLAAMGLPVAPNLYDYEVQPLTEQLNAGIRSFELDAVVQKNSSGTAFLCCHMPMVDMSSTCIDLLLALEEIALWSRSNPNHLPITILLEAKSVVLPAQGLRPLTQKTLQQLDGLMREVLGDALLTPADMLGNHADFKQMREESGWPLLKDTLGKVLVILHEGPLTRPYIWQDSSLRTQAMFPSLRYSDRNNKHAGFILANKAEKARSQAEELIAKRDLIVRTRLDSFPYHKPEEFAAALESGAQILSTDFPPASSGEQPDYIAWLSPGKTVLLAQD